MYPLNDNDLDRLSREAADQYDVESSTSGWEALEHRLNKELPPKEDEKRRRFLFWLFLIVILAGGGVLWTMTSRDRVTAVQLTGTKNLPDSPERNGAPVTGEEKGASATGNTPGTAKDGSIAPTPGQLTGGSKAAPQPATADQLATPHNDQKVSTTRIDTDTRDQRRSNNTIQGKRAKTTSAGNAVIDTDGQMVRVPANSKRTNSMSVGGTYTDGQSASIPVKGKRTTTAPAGNPLIDTDRQSASISSKDNRHTTPAPAILVGDQPSVDKAGMPASSYQDPQASEVQAPGLLAGRPGAIKAPPLTLAIENSDKPARLERKKQSKGWELGLLAGPDMSNVRFTDVDKAGYNLGLQVAYRFSDRWSVNTGFVYTRKNYTAQGKDFTKPNTNYWNQANVTQVAGYCSMFDIPLNVRYDLSIHKKMKWFASVGASSYIMTNENYLVDYQYNGTPRIYPHEEYANKTYLFSIVNFSAGFERKLNQRLSLQAEPYFKLPTKGLGYGKLDLNSYGLYFSLRYQLHR